MLDRKKLDEEKSPDEILKLLLPWIEEESERYRPKHLEWEKNALFYLGKHWIEKRADAEGYFFFEEDEDHFYPVTNYAKLLVDFKLNQVSGKQAVSVVKPASLSPNDIANARLADSALRAQHVIDDDKSIDRVTILHSEIFGIGWRSDIKECVPDKYIESPAIEEVEIHEYECETCGYKAEDPMCPECGTESVFKPRVEEQEVIDPMTGMPVMTQNPIYRISSQSTDPFRLMTSRANSAKKRTFIIDQSIQSVRWVKGGFTKKTDGFTGLAEKVKKTERLPRSIKISEDLKSAMALKNSAIFNTALSAEKQFKNEEDSTLFYKIYFDPTAAYPRGRLIVMTPDAVLYDGKPDVPVKNKRYKWWHPYSDYVWALHPMNSEGVSLIGDLIPINKQINALDAMFMEYMDKAATPTMVEFDNVMKNEDDNTDGVIRIRAVPGLPNGGMPTYLTAPSVSSDIFKYRQYKVEEMEKIAKVPAVIQGLHTTGVDTFRGMKLLRESAESAEADQYNRYFEYCANYNKLKLCLIQECMIAPDSEMAALMYTLNDNEGNNADALDTFIGADLSDMWNLEIEETDYMSNTKAAEQESITDAIGKNIITQDEMSADPLMKYNILEQLGLGGMVDTFGSDDIKKANWIIQLLESKDFDKLGKVVQSFDNKTLQLRVLISWMKKPKFYSLDPQIQQAALALQKDIENEVIKSTPPPPPTQPPPASPSGSTVP